MFPITFHLGQIDSLYYEKQLLQSSKRNLPSRIEQKFSMIRRGKGKGAFRHG